MRWVVALALGSVVWNGSATARANALPYGYLDRVDGLGFYGWAYDPDAGAAPIDVHVYIYGPGDVVVDTVVATADGYRPDLCAAVGSCNHAFFAPMPPLPDGRYWVDVFAINAPSGTNPPLVHAAHAPIALDHLHGAGLKVTSWYRGTVVSKAGYDYAPAVLSGDDGTIHMWWCGAGPGAPTPGDQIYHATSADGLSWSQPEVAIASDADPNSPRFHTCDPAVVRASNDVYYLYYTAASIAGGNNHIYLAISTDAHSWGLAFGGAPVIGPTNPKTYGAGQSAVLFWQTGFGSYHDGGFLHYFTDVAANGVPVVYAAKSYDGGKTWVQKTPVPGVRNTLDVAYSTTYGVYVEAQAVPQADGTSVLQMTWSPDGISFPVPESQMARLALGGGAAHAYAHNGGLLRNRWGAIGASTIFYYGAGANDLADDGAFNNSTAPTWDIDATVVYLNRDADEDGFIAPGEGGTDCDDARADVYPGAPELCDGRDNDCDGNTDEGLGDACDDGNVCNGVEVCAGGSCQPGTPLECDDANPCTTDACVPAVGCVHTANTAPCDDGDPCTVGDSCVAGACVPGQPDPCCTLPYGCDPCAALGDVDASGTVSVVDTQCVVLTILASLGSTSAPLCLYGPPFVADLDCSGTVDVADAALSVRYALGLPLDAALDADGNACPDACQAP